MSDDGAQDGDAGDDRGDGQAAEGGDRGDRGDDADDKGEDKGEDWGDDDGDDGDDRGDDGDDRGDDKGGEEIRDCYQCWGEFPVACEAELVACKEDLACTQLQECPAACGYELKCVAECNEIIPAGVEPLTALLQCMVCDAEAPCAPECDNDVMLSYCE